MAVPVQVNLPEQAPSGLAGPDEVTSPSPTLASGPTVPTFGDNPLSKVCASPGSGQADCCLGGDAGVGRLDTLLAVTRWEAEQTLKSPDVRGRMVQGICGG